MGAAEWRQPEEPLKEERPVGPARKIVDVDVVKSEDTKSDFELV